LRIADAPSELRDNRRGEVELFASPAAALAALSSAAGDRPSPVDRDWASGLRKRHVERAEKLRATMASAPDGKRWPHASESAAGRSAAKLRETRSWSPTEATSSASPG